MLRGLRHAGSLEKTEATKQRVVWLALRRRGRLLPARAEGSRGQSPPRHRCATSPRTRASGAGDVRGAAASPRITSVPPALARRRASHLPATSPLPHFALPCGACTGAPSSAPERLAPELAAAAATGAARSISCAYPDPGHRFIWARTVSALKRWTRTRSKRGWSERIDLKVADWCQMGELSVMGVPFWR